MRAHELYEYSQRSFSHDFGGRFITKWAAEGKPYVDEIGENGEKFIQWLSKYDPTQNKKYVKWIAGKYAGKKGGISKLEDITSRLRHDLNRYEELKRSHELQPEHKDINQIPTLVDLSKIVKQYKDVDASSQKEPTQLTSKNVETVYDGPDYSVLIPKTFEASKKLCGDAEWCTAYPNEYEKYSSQGPLYIITHKPSGDKWQFHFETGQYMDADDEDIEIILFFIQHKKLFDVFKKLGRVDYKNESIRIGSEYFNKRGKRHRLDGPALEGADGTKEWWVDGKLHRLDGPAIEDVNGTKTWFIDGKIHRLDGPAIEHADGTKHWYVDDKRHRLDGPAVEGADGTKQWWVDGKLHRLDGFAIEDVNRTKHWYVDDKRHRLDGPAVEYADGTKYWYVDDQKYDQEEWIKVVKKIKAEQSKNLD